jgi:hypothetical protein
MLLRSNCGRAAHDIYRRYGGDKGIAGEVRRIKCEEMADGMTLHRDRKPGIMCLPFP